MRMVHARGGMLETERGTSPARKAVAVSTAFEGLPSLPSNLCSCVSSCSNILPVW